jgi:hypothetical protein
MSRNGIFYISLGAKSISVACIEKVLTAAKSVDDRLTVCLLDIPEEVNLVYLERLTLLSARERIASRCQQFTHHLLQLGTPPTAIRLWSQYAQLPEFLPYLQALRHCFKTSPPFRRHCLSQVFCNLQPLLRRCGILGKAHPTVAALSDYLLMEVAIKLYMASERIVSVEYSIFREMSLVEAIFAGKYTSLADFCKYRPDYEFVENRHEIKP